MRARVGDVVAQADGTAQAARRKYRSVETAFQTYDRDKRAVGNVLAGAVAFRLFVYLLPLVLAIMTLLGIIAGFKATEPQHLAGSAGLGHTVVSSVATATAASKKSLWALIPLSLYALYSGGTGVIKVLRAVHAVAWGEPLSKMQKGVRSAFALFVVAAGLVAVVVLLQWIRKQSGGLGLTATVMTVVVFTAAWLLASRALPHGDAPWRALLPGAILVGVGVEALHLVSTYYLGNKIASASEMYGSLGAAAAIIAWLYLIGRLFVAAAMLNASAWERRTGAPGNGRRAVRHHFDGRVLTLGGDDKHSGRVSTLVRGPSRREDGEVEPRSGKG
ncbi:MAG: YihY/virulence factor BrkB family protein [Acidimicrobiia bacterium]|nr:YihY/virulence factor BrkB family protein [Acidimicrobiia bacterium]